MFLCSSSNFTLSFIFLFRNTIFCKNWNFHHQIKWNENKSRIVFLCDYTIWSLTIQLALMLNCSCLEAQEENKEIKPRRQSCYSVVPTDKIFTAHPSSFIIRKPQFSTEKWCCFRRRFALLLRAWYLMIHYLLYTPRVALGIPWWSRLYPILNRGPFCMNFFSDLGKVSKSRNRNLQQIFNWHHQNLIRLSVGKIKVFSR